MARRVCAEPGCPTLTNTTRCPEHAKARDKARGTRQERGYDNTHDKLRARYITQINAGQVVHCVNPNCLLLGQPIVATPGLPQSLHLEHNPDRTHRGPGHAACNLSEAGKARH